MTSETGAAENTPEPAPIIIDRRAQTSRQKLIGLALTEALIAGVSAAVVVLAPVSIPLVIPVGISALAGSYLVFVRGRRLEQQAVAEARTSLAQGAGLQGMVEGLIAKVVGSPTEPPAPQA